MLTPYLSIKSVQDVLAVTGTELVNLYHTDPFAPFVANLTLDLDEKSCGDMGKMKKPPFEHPRGLAKSNLLKIFANSPATQLVCIHIYHESFKRLASESN